MRALLSMIFFVASLHCASAKVFVGSMKDQLKKLEVNDYGTLITYPVDLDHDLFKYTAQYVSDTGLQTQLALGDAYGFEHGIEVDMGLTAHEIRISIGPASSLDHAQKEVVIPKGTKVLGVTYMRTTIIKSLVFKMSGAKTIMIDDQKIK